jgi:hypothetical protein
MLLALILTITVFSINTLLHHIGQSSGTVDLLIYSTSLCLYLMPILLPSGLFLVVTVRALFSDKEEDEYAWLIFLAILFFPLFLHEHEYEYGISLLRKIFALPAFLYNTIRNSTREHYLTESEDITPTSIIASGVYLPISLISLLSVLDIVATNLDWLLALAVVGALVVACFAALRLSRTPLSPPSPYLSSSHIAAMLAAATEEPSHERYHDWI